MSSTNLSEIHDRTFEFLTREREKHQSKVEFHTAMVNHFDQEMSDLLGPLPSLLRVVKDNPKTNDSNTELPDYRLDMTHWQKALRTFLFLNRKKQKVSGSELIDHIATHNESYRTLGKGPFRKNFHGNITKLKNWGVFILDGQSTKKGKSDMFTLNPDIPMGVLYKCLSDVKNPYAVIKPYKRNRQRANRSS